MSKRQNGFTLVELLVVIGIVALLVSILLPALNRVRESAKVVACLSNLKQLSLGIHMYANDNRGSLPRYAATTAPSTTWKRCWVTLGWSYFGRSSKLFECPGRVFSTDPTNNTAGFTWDDGRPYSVRVCYRVNAVEPPGFTAPTSNVSNCGQDKWFPFGPTLENVGGVAVDTEKTCKLSSVDPQSIMLVETVRGGQPGEERSAGEVNAANTFMAVRSIAITNHGGRSGSMSFFDGHAEAVPVAELKNNFAKYQVVGYVGPVNLNRGLPGDLEIKFNNSNAPRGLWTAKRGD